jgi:hypothetical protein
MVINASVQFALFLAILAGVGVLSAATASAHADLSREEMMDSFLDPPMDCRPHTRWWWMGNAIRKEDLTWQLEQMREQGLGGVEQITMGEVYEKGNHPYLSEEYLDLVRHAIQEAKRLGMEFSLNFGGPGWVIAGEWVPPEDRSKNMVPTSVDLQGPRTFSGSLPSEIKKRFVSWSIEPGKITDEDPLIAVVAGPIVENRLQESSLVDLTSQVQERSLHWEVPEGQWRLMAFWLKRTGQGNAVDHFNKGAMERYCDFLGSKFRAGFGEEFGKTVESFFCDSFEVALLGNGIYWTDGLMERFRDFKGYDLTQYLPAIWWQVDDITPKIRYDVNEFLHHVGLDAFFKTFLDWCDANGVRGRIQPYGFPTDILEGAGMTHLPEMEITPGEKDAVPWFDTRIGPKKYVASGAHLYGRNVVTVEAYTFLHWETYRGAMEEVKIAADGFLRSGANKFYNHGYTCSPERDIAPSRRFSAEVLISHSNVWWKYCRLLSDYVARCSFMLRQGGFTADVAVYSPLANQWTLDCLNARRWTRDFDWGHLGQLLSANGYDFDLINDDVLQNHADISNGSIRVLDLEYKILIIPNIEALPLESMERIQEYVRRGGVVIALERLPECSAGFQDYQQGDEKVRSIVTEMFRAPRGRNDTAPCDYGKGRTYFIEKVMDRSNVLDWQSSALDPFLKTLRHHLTPDFGIDFVRQGIRENEGLTFVHRKMPNKDIYFVTNIQDRAVDMPIAFRVTGKIPWEWNPYTGGVSRVYEYEEKGDVTVLPMRLASYESTFIVFEAGRGEHHLVQSDFHKALFVDDQEIVALAGENGVYTVTRVDGKKERTQSIVVDGIPAPYNITGDWQLALEGKGFPRRVTTLSRLNSWTETPETKHFSGTGEYAIRFDLPSYYIADDLRLMLTVGDVGNIAEVELNGQTVGVCWMRGQSLDISNVVNVGSNHLKILVTNTLINRVAGLKEMPPVPEHLQPHFGQGLHDKSPLGRTIIGFEPLPRSGLMGPVKIQALREVRISRR